MSPSRPARWPSRPVPLVPAALAALLLSACPSMRFHKDRNAPGHVEIATPPDYQNHDPGAHDVPGTELPDDPGENLVAFTPGFYGGGGARTGKPDGEEGTYIVGVELTVNHGQTPYSHYKDAFFVYPLEGRGLSLGWEFLQGRGGELDTGPVYLEGHGFFAFMGAGLGYAADIGDREHGPQVTVWLGPLQMRSRYLFGGGGFEFMASGVIKLPLVWIFSR